MAPPEPLPTYVYKIVPAAPPSPIPAQYPLSDLDQKDGFVHLSTATQLVAKSIPRQYEGNTAPQIPLTADLFFTDAKALWILKVRFKSDFHGDTTWEVSGCPHLHGNFGAEDVEGTKAFSRSEGENWKDAMERQGGFLV